MTDAELERIAALASAATPGEWGLWTKGEQLTITLPEERDGAYLNELTFEDGLFISAARDAVPALITALQEARADVAHARAWAAWHAGGRDGEHPAEPLAGDSWCGECALFHHSQGDEEEATP